jgi:hypothetical protein
LPECAKSIKVWLSAIAMNIHGSKPVTTLLLFMSFEGTLDGWQKHNAAELKRVPLLTNRYHAALRERTLIYGKL